MKNFVLLLALLLVGISFNAVGLYAAEDETVDIFPADEQCLKVLCEEGIFLIEPNLKRSEFRELPKEHTAIEATDTSVFELENQVILYTKITTDGISSCTYANGKFTVSSYNELVPNQIYKDTKGRITAILRQKNNMQAKQAKLNDDGTVEWIDHDNIKEAVQGAARQIKNGAAIAMAAVNNRRPANTPLRELDSLEFAGKNYKLQLNTEDNICTLSCSDKNAPGTFKKLSDFSWDAFAATVDETRVKLVGVFTETENAPVRIVLNLQNTSDTEKSDLLYTVDGGKNWDFLLDKEWNGKHAMSVIAPTPKK